MHAPRSTFATMLAVTGALMACRCSMSVQSGNTPGLDAAPATEDAAREDTFSTPADAPPAVREAGPEAGRDGAATDARTVRRGPPYPIFLAHGFAGFRDALGVLTYFFRVADDLRGRGERVFEAQVSAFDSPQTRARQLGPQLDRFLADTGAEKAIVIAHSQGGLDSRYMISTLGYGDRIALLVTVSTPHQGTYVADAIAQNVPVVTDALLNGIAAIYGVAVGDARSRPDIRASLASMETGAMTRFNQDNPDDPRVAYWSWAGRSNRRNGTVQCGGSRIPNEPSRLDSAQLLMLPFVGILEQGNADVHVNDGLVEVRSARWGIFQGCVPADHVDEVGQIGHTGPVAESGFDHLAFYRDIVTRAHAAGF